VTDVTDRTGTGFCPACGGCLTPAPAYPDRLTPDELREHRVLWGLAHFTPCRNPDCPVPARRSFALLTDDEKARLHGLLCKLHGIDPADPDIALPPA
jgi:hypothetical protein